MANANLKIGHMIPRPRVKNLDLGIVHAASALSFGLHYQAIDVTTEPGFGVPAIAVLAVLVLILENIAHDLGYENVAVFIIEQAAGPLHVALREEAVGCELSGGIRRHVIANLWRINRLVGHIMAGTLIGRSGGGLVALTVPAMLVNRRFGLLLRRRWRWRGCLGRLMSDMLRKCRNGYAKRQRSEKKIPAHVAAPPIGRTLKT